MFKKIDARLWTIKYCSSEEIIPLNVKIMPEGSELPSFSLRASFLFYLYSIFIISIRGLKPSPNVPDLMLDYFLALVNHFSCVLHFDYSVSFCVFVCLNRKCQLYLSNGSVANIY